MHGTEAASIKIEVLATSLVVLQCSYNNDLAHIAPAFVNALSGGRVREEDRFMDNGGVAGGNCAGAD